MLQKNEKRAMIYPNKLHIEIRESDCMKPLFLKDEHGATE